MFRPRETIYSAREQDWFPVFKTLKWNKRSEMREEDLSKKFKNDREVRILHLNDNDEGLEMRYHPNEVSLGPSHSDYIQLVL